MILAPGAPGAHESPAVAAAYRAETRALVRARFPIAASIFLVLMAIAYGIEWLYFPERVWLLALSYLAFVAITSGALALLRHRPRRAIAIALGASVVLSFALATYLALVHRSAELTLLAMIGFLTGLVVQFPWGVRGQLGAALGAIVAYLGALPFCAATTLPVPYGLFALVSHALMTVIGARLLDGYRFAAFREASEAARHAAESQRANAAKSEFLATVSHELRTPLNIIVGYTDLMLEGSFRQDHEQRDALGRIHRQSLQLLDLIQSMLDLNRMEAGGILLALEEFTVASALDGLRTGLPANWSKPGVTLDWQMNDAAARMRSDRGKLAMVLRNLIHNACKYTDSGSVTVTAEVDRERGWVEFVVSDTGSGIDAADLSCIFEMFGQGSSGPPLGGGVGLGLYIAKRLTDALGGTIAVESCLGGGARFTVSLPLRAAGPSGGDTSPDALDGRGDVQATSASARRRS